MPDRSLIDLTLIGPSEAETFWTAFLRKLARRGLRGVKIVVFDSQKGIKAAVSKVLTATWQRCRVGLLKKSVWVTIISPRPCLAQPASIGEARAEQPSRADQKQPRSKKCDCQPLEVHSRCGEQYLDALVWKATSDSTSEAVPCLRFAMVTFRPPAVALVKPSVLVGRALTPAPGAQKRGIVVTHDHSLVDAPFERHSAARC